MWWPEQAHGTWRRKRKTNMKRVWGPCVPQVEVMETLWHFPNRTVTWSVRLKRSHLIVEKWLATKRFKAKSIPFLATLQNWVYVPRAFALSNLPSFLSFPHHVFYFFLNFLYKSQILLGFRIKENERKKTKKGKKADGEADYQFSQQKGKWTLLWHILLKFRDSIAHIIQHKLWYVLFFFFL